MGGEGGPAGDRQPRRLGQDGGHWRYKLPHWLNFFFGAPSASLEAKVR